MNITLLGSIIFRLVREDPEGFAAKLAERLRQSGVPGSHLLIPTVRSFKPQELADRGELFRAVDLVRSSSERYGVRGERLLRRLENQLEELQMKPPYRGAVPTSASSSHRVLHLLTNSVPFTASGYTQRSHSVLKAINNAGIAAEAVTRLGYPYVVGRWPRSGLQTIDGVVYRRQLPRLYPGTQRERHMKSVAILTELVKQRDFSAIHTTTNYPNAIVASRVATRVGIPWFYEVRGELERTWLSRISIEKQREAEASSFYNLARAQETRYAKAADAVIVLSEISREQLVDRGVAAEKITVIPNAVNSALLEISADKRKLRRELGLPVDKILVGTVSAVVDYEGLDILIRALEGLPEKYSALIVGEGAARPALEKLADELHVRDRVFFPGHQDPGEIWKWYSALDVFTVPRHDTPVCRTVTPIKALSAQALGIPVVASDLPALREVTGGVAKYVPAGDAQALAAKIREENWGSEGPRWAAQRTWETVGQRYLELYADFGIVP